MATINVRHCCGAHLRVEHEGMYAAHVVELIKEFLDTHFCIELGPRPTPDPNDGERAPAAPIRLEVTA